MIEQKVLPSKIKEFKPIIVTHDKNPYGNVDSISSNIGTPPVIVPVIDAVTTVINISPCALQNGLHPDGYVHDHMTFASANPNRYKSLKHVDLIETLEYMVYEEDIAYKREIYYSGNEINTMESLRTDKKYWNKSWICQECLHLGITPGLFNGGFRCLYDHNENTVSTHCPEFEQMLDYRVYQEIRRNEKLSPYYYISPLLREEPKSIPRGIRIYGRGKIKCADCTKGEHILHPKWGWTVSTKCHITGEERSVKDRHFCKDFEDKCHNLPQVNLYTDEIIKCIKRDSNKRNSIMERIYLIIKEARVARNKSMVSKNRFRRCQRARTYIYRRR